MNSAPNPGRASLARRGQQAVSGVLARVARSSRLKGEVFWVGVLWIAHSSMLLASVKIFTNLLETSDYGEFQLTRSAILIAGNLLVLPVVNTFTRQYHRLAEEHRLLRISDWVTRYHLLLGASSAILIGPTLAGAAWLGVAGFGASTALVGAAAFGAFFVRSLVIQHLSITRRRKVHAIQHSGFLIGEVGIGAIAVLWLGPSPAAALSGTLISSTIVAAIGLPPILRRLKQQQGIVSNSAEIESVDSSDEPQAQPRAEVQEVRSADTQRSSERTFVELVWSFGVPTGLLALTGTIQSQGDRFILNGMLDTAAVGRYVAVFQISAMTFLPLRGVIEQLIKPIAFQRGRDLEDATQLWAADRVILLGMGLFSAVGAVLLGVYGLFGPQLVSLVADESYVVGVGIIVTMAFARFMQNLAVLMELIFQVHHCTERAFALRAAGAALTLLLCGVGIYFMGFFGAALGTMIATVAYTMMLMLVPKGAFWLILDARRAALRAKN